MKNVFKIFLLLTITFSYINAQEVSINFLIGCANLYKEKFDSAIFYFEKAIKENPFNQKILYYLGQAYYFNKNYDKAIEYFSKLIDSKNYESYLWLARTYSKLNDKTNALQNLKNYLLNETYKIPSYKIKKDEAFKNLISTKDWYELWQENWYSKEEIICEEVELLLNKNLINDARRSLDTTSYSKKREDLIRYYQAITEFRAGNLHSALSYINQALSINKSKKEYIEFKINILISLSYYKESVELINQFLKIAPENFEYYLKRAKAFSLIGQHEQALKDLQFYYNFFPENYAIAFELAKSYNLNNKFIESLKILNTLITSDPSKHEYYLERGKAFYYSNMFLQAENDFSMVLDLNPDTGEAYYYLGLINLRKNNKQNACEYFNKALLKGIKKSVSMILDNCQ